MLRWLWWRITAWGELAAILVSAVLAPILLAALDGGDAEALRLLVMFAGSTATAIVVSLLIPHASTERVVEFYRRAHPPGWWGPIARAAGETRDDLRRLGLGLVTVAVAALSIFSVLTAVGSLITQSAPPTWFPWRGPWLVTVALVGLGLVPVWRALARRLDR